MTPNYRWTHRPQRGEFAYRGLSQGSSSSALPLGLSIRRFDFVAIWLT